MKDKWINIIYLSIPFCNITLFKSGGFRGILIPEIIIIIFIISNFRYLLRINTLLILVLASVFPFLWLSSIVSFGEFMKTYLSSLFYFIFIIAIINIPTKFSAVKSFITGLKIVILYGVVQMGAYFLKLDYYKLLYRPFEKYAFSYLPFSDFKGIPRSNSLFYEPSIYGLMCLIGLGICLYYKDRFKLSDCFICLVGVATSLSASTIAGALILLILNYFLNYEQTILNKFFSFAVGVIIIYEVWIHILVKRFSEIGIPGTSGYYRLVAPLELVKYFIIEKHPFGVAMGQTDIYLRYYKFPFMQMAGVPNTSIDSIPFVIICYTGLLSIVILLLIAKLIMNKIDRKDILLIVPLGMLTVSTGAFNFIYYNIALSIVICCVRTHKQEIVYN